MTERVARGEFSVGSKVLHAHLGGVPAQKVVRQTGRTVRLMFQDEGRSDCWERRVAAGRRTTCDLSSRPDQPTGLTLEPLPF
jgi:hypothetical protein